MRLGTKCLLWTFLAICIVFTGLQFVALHKLGNSADGQNLDVPYHLSKPSLQTPDESSSSRISPSAQQQQRHHIIFSTSCHYTQDWQSYLFFFQAMKVNQPGDVTRIVSGCNSDQQKELQKIFDSLIGSMSDRFHIHFTPGMLLL